MASYPTSIKTFTTLVDNVDDVLASHQNERGNEITAIETALKSFTSFTPSWTNLSVGNGTNAGYYTNDGGWISGYILLTWGSTTSISGAVSVSLPVSSSGSVSILTLLGEAILVDAGTGSYLCKLLKSAGTVVDLYALNASATYASFTAVNATVPFTWTTNDQILVTFRYKAA